MNLVPYDPNLWLRLLVSRWQAQARARRERLQVWIDQTNTVTEKFISEQCAYEKRKLIEAKAALRAHARGIPLTEVLDDVTALDDEIPTLSDAEQFLLKKAYRMAAQLVHPDHAVDDADRKVREARMQALRAAYLAKDLRAVQEFVLHLDKAVPDQAQYWLEERDRADITWARFRTTFAFQVAQEIQRGRVTDELRMAVKRYLVQLRLQHEAQLINMQAHAVLRSADPEQFDKP